MERVQIKFTRLRLLYALIGAVNDATDDYAASMYVGKFSAYVHITEINSFDRNGWSEYIYYPGETSDNPCIHTDDEDLTGAEAALLEILERLKDDRQSETV